MLLDGISSAETAIQCGFADQSHFGRLFKTSFGLSPKAWLRAASAAHDRSISGGSGRPR
jgi:AraC-like DNA-binding protein